MTHTERTEPSGPSRPRPLSRPSEPRDAYDPQDPSPLGRILAAPYPEFALLHRPRTGPADRIEVLVGDSAEVARLADIPLREGTAGRDAGTGSAEHEVLVVVPYRQLAERGFEAVDDGAPVITLRVRTQTSMPVAEALTRLPDIRADLADGGFDLDDAAYADLVRRMVEEEIGSGEGANFVVRRTFVADISAYSPLVALAVFRRLLERERGAYWTFVVHAGGRTFVGATPERHLSLADGVAVMNPISGTYRYPAQGPTLTGVLSFLADAKEADELSMVVDEELKMMARISDSGVRAHGPRLVEMAGLAHTEYVVEGRTSADVRDVLRETLFAPTVTGSPLESAAKVVRRFEPHGRGYYSGVLALIGRDAEGGRTLDSSILIRTAVIDAAGRMTLGVGATVVRDSDPWAEAAETRAKAAGLLSALGHEPEPESESVPEPVPEPEPEPERTVPSAKPGPGRRLGSGPGPASYARHPDVLAALRQRNSALSSFWLGDTASDARPVPGLVGRRVLVVDAEDTFTALWDHQLRSLGPVVTVRRFDEAHAPDAYRLDAHAPDAYDLDAYDLVVLGPGPGDPRRLRHPKIARLRTLTRRLLDEGRPFLSVCLSHQVLSGLLGLDLVRKEHPDQGVQRKIDLFGRPELVGFYNTFAARTDTDLIVAPGAGDVVEVCRDRENGQVHALRGPGFRSVQFHPESVLSQNGPALIADLLVSLLEERRPPADRFRTRRATERRDLCVPAH
ncbi:anthranilate synthase family protein [Streptomyces scabiei]|uniref:anthranilate synthase family protein n=1 Tax=Streptomyces scabiei TaxID=1930 RepID=UPI0029A9DCA3|nr:anthranilate synthase family protein [Streptomyces scabiei]MDX3282360.1 anthranilate synthase family protein [Streptomyces scabiei]